MGVTLDLPLAVAAAAGATFLVTSLALMQRWDLARHMAGAGRDEVLFPSPS